PRIELERPAAPVAPPTGGMLEVVPALALPLPAADVAAPALPALPLVTAPLAPAAVSGESELASPPQAFNSNTKTTVRWPRKHEVWQ
ncbi:MAG TPA: hypothetical protein VJV78_25170, partial [Polyangiales bacterium]|nr:hypothetical protein [Polyangiales bacterium]